MLDADELAGAVLHAVALVHTRAAVVVADEHRDEQARADELSTNSSSAFLGLPPVAISVVITAAPGIRANGRGA
jgi:hypothetical protein